jgi:hypothetical protein
MKISILQKMIKFQYKSKLISRKYFMAPWKLLDTGEAGRSDSWSSDYTYVHNNRNKIFYFDQCGVFHFLPWGCHEICALVARTSVYYSSIANTSVFRTVIVKDIHKFATCAFLGCWCTNLSNSWDSNQRWYCVHHL